MPHKPHKRIPYSELHTKLHRHHVAENRLSLSSELAALTEDTEDEVSYVLNNNLDTPSDFHHSGYHEFYKEKTSFCTGSAYAGTYNYLGFSGYGIYIYPYETAMYEGEFEDGLFHGSGILKYSNNEVLIGRFKQGDLVLDSAVIHVDNKKLIDPKKLNYCQMPDRRYLREMKEGRLRPVIKENLTNSKKPRTLPPDSYDTGDGVNFVKKNIILEDNGDPNTPAKTVRIPSEEEEEWIKKNCRNDRDDAVGYHKDLYENWTAGQKSGESERKKSFETDDGTADFNFLSFWSESQVSQDSDTDSSSSDSLEADPLELILMNISRLLKGSKTKLPCGHDSISDTLATNFIDYYSASSIDSNELIEKFCNRTDEGEYEDYTMDDIDSFKQYLDSIVTDVPEYDSFNSSSIRYNVGEVINSQHTLIVDDEVDNQYYENDDDWDSDVDYTVNEVYDSYATEDEEGFLSPLNSMEYTENEELSEQSSKQQIE